jgi:hypothetical protein
MSSGMCRTDAETAIAVGHSQRPMPAPVGFVAAPRRALARAPASTAPRAAANLTLVERRQRALEIRQEALRRVARKAGASSVIPSAPSAEASGGACSDDAYEVDELSSSNEAASQGRILSAGAPASSSGGGAPCDVASASCSAASIGPLPILST